MVSLSYKMQHLISFVNSVNGPKALLVEAEFMEAFRTVEPPLENITAVVELTPNGALDTLDRAASVVCVVRSAAVLLALKALGEFSALHVYTLSTDVNYLAALFQTFGNMRMIDAGRGSL